MEKRSVTSCELPSSYGDNVINLLVQSPICIYAYWELSPESMEMASRHFKTAWSHLTLYLRLYDITGLNFNGENAHGFIEFCVDSSWANYYFTLVSAGRTYCVDLGVKRGEDFLCLLRSNAVQTPPDQVSFADIPGVKIPAKHISPRLAVSSESYYLHSK
ncbi:MAG: DUF4912 domain-containing protein [Firmicutes bacterium HGW-Firmicutes-13]|nr:MAG: DUF4912 domain-containing protein [Firmicutes bacterium HGW-Firmicutes-13]